MTALTQGVDHVGLSVRDLEATKSFFINGLGWTVKGENPSYPAAYVTDGATMVTLWQVEDPKTATPFDRRANVGLHHLALKVADLEALNTAFEAVKDLPGLEVEFAPEPSGGGPKIHAMVREPSGNRIELSWDPR